MSGANEPPLGNVGVVVDTRIEDGDSGDEDKNSRTPQTATIESCFREGVISDASAQAIARTVSDVIGEPLPLIYGRVRVSSPEGRAVVSVDDGAESPDTSDRYAIAKGMKGLVQGAEAEARLHGLMAILSLPLVREGKVIVQVEVKPDTWQRVDGVNIDDQSVTFLSGTNGKAIPFRFLNVEGVPAWRTVALAKRQRNTLEHE